MSTSSTLSPSTVDVKMRNLRRYIKETTTQPCKTSSNFRKSRTPVQSVTLLTKISKLSGGFTDEELKTLLKGRSIKSKTYKKTKSLVLTKARHVLSIYDMTRREEYIASQKQLEEEEPDTIDEEL